MHQIDPPASSTKSALAAVSPSPGDSSDKKRSLEDGDETPVKPKLQRPNVLEMVDRDWDEESVKKLLEGIQKFQTDWLRVAQYVGNKTPEQCILRFLQLPIEDAYLQSQSGEELGPLKYAPHLPFSKADNPVMSTIAFLAGLVDPKTVKKMTSRAIDSVKQERETLSAEGDNYVKEGSEIALASIGLRSHVFATNEERQMTALAHDMVQTQMKKINLKLKLLGTMEKSLEMEKKALQKQQEDVFIQRLSLAKHSQTLTAKIQQCLDDHDDKEKLQAHLNAIKEMQAHPARISIGKSQSSSKSAVNGSSQEQAFSSTSDLNEPFVKPVSVDAPQSYRYWSG